MDVTLAKLNQRSVLTFFLLTVIAGAVTLFLLKKADTAVSEIGSLQSSPVFVARKEYVRGVEAVRVSGWKTYRNEKYGFEMQYPGDFDETSSFAEFGASGGKAYREVYVNIIPPVATFPEYLIGLAVVRAKGQRDGRLVVFKKSAESVAGREAFHEELYDRSISAFAVRAFIDFTPRAIISVTVRQNDELGSATEAPAALKTMSEQIISTFRHIP